MRIGELSRRTGVPIPTIKYYVRERLLPAGELTSPNQAAYGEAHERRLRLIRALTNVGGLPVAAVADVLTAVDDPQRPLHSVLGTASHTVGARRVRDAGEVVEEPDAAKRRATDVARELFERRGWGSQWAEAECAPSVEALVEALAETFRVGHGHFADALDTYADAAEQVARADLAYVGKAPAVADMVEGVIVGTVVGDAVFAALRRLAHTAESERLYGGGDDGRQS